MRFDVQTRQLLARSDTFSDTAAEAIESRDDDSDRLPLGAHRPYLDHESLVLRTVVSGARHYVCEFRSDCPAHAGRVVATLPKLRVQAHTLAGLLVTADSRVDEGRRDAR